MCLGVPGQVVEWIDRDPLMALAEIDFGGLKKRIHMACAPDAQVGEYVLVHAGIAITVIDAQAARQLLSELEETTSPPLGEDYSCRGEK